MAEDDGGLAGQRWSLAVFSAREDPIRLMDCLAAAANADRLGATLAIDIIINGNRPLALEMRSRLPASADWQSRTSIRLWCIPEADKAHAWNHYLGKLIPPAHIAFFMDGYVRIEPWALARMADALREHPRALAATSVPSTGRSAEILRRRFLAEGGLHGNLYAMTGNAISRLRSAGFRLPTNIYRNDSALGAALAFNLDPSRYAWNRDRIVVVPEADYDAPVARATRLSDVRTVIRRRLRQAQGKLETLALRTHLADEKRAPAEWPDTTRDLILQWSQDRRSEARRLLWSDPLAFGALLRLRMQSDRARERSGAECLGHFGSSRKPPVSGR